MINPHLLNPTDVTVGWEQTSYTVSEDVGTFQAYYSVTFPAMTTWIANPFFTRVATVSGTAGEKFICVCSIIITVYNTMHIQMRMTTNAYVVVSRNNSSLTL